MNIYENIRLVSYVSVADAFDKNKNVFHSFIPMVESMLLLSEGKLTISFLALQQRINEIYQVKIPKDTLKYLLGILEAQGKVRIISGKTVVPTREKIADNYLEYEHYKNDIEDFFIKFQQYLIESGLDVAISGIRNQVCDWVYTHSSDLAEFIQKGKLITDQHDKDKEEWEYLSQFLSFLVECRDKNAAEYKAFIRIFDGAVQTSLLNFSPSQISEVSDTKFEISHVVLDTNFVLRLLKLQASIDNETAYDTWKQLQSSGTEFYVLEQTIQEASASIKWFLAETAPYSQSAKEFLQHTKIQASGFYDAFKNGMTRTDFFEYSKPETLRKTLGDSFSVTVIDDYNASPAAEDILSLIQSKDIETYGEAQSKHDLLLISYCRKMRPRRLQSISKAQWWVLTNDKRLTYWNQSNCGEIQECITEVQLSNLLWLQERKSSNDGLSNTIVALAAKYSLGSNDISRFAQQIIHYKEKYAENVAKLDSLALAFASGALTNEDVKTGILDEDRFEETIENKATAYRNEHLQTEERLRETSKSNDEKEKEIILLRTQLQKTAELRTIDKDTIDAQKELENAQNMLNQVENVLLFTRSKTKHAARTVLLSLLIPLAIVTTLAIVFLLKPLTKFLTADNVNLLISIIGSGLIAFIFWVIYYCVVILITGTPLNPKEMFIELRDRKLQKMREKYVKEKNGSSSLINDNLETLKKMYESNVCDNEKKLNDLTERKNVIQQDLDSLIMQGQS